MTYAFFYPVNNNKDYDRHTFDEYHNDKIIAQMLCEVEGIRAYNLESRTRGRELCLFDLQDDYNNEDLDGGYWLKILNL